MQVFVMIKKHWNNDECRKKCTCRKKLVDKLVGGCSENIDESEMIYNITLYDYENVCGSCTIYTVLFAIAFLISLALVVLLFIFIGT